MSELLICFSTGVILVGYPLMACVLLRRKQQPK